MRYALVGYGKMGRAVDAAASARGHRRALVVDRGTRGRGTVRSMEGARLRGVDVAFEFTEGEGAASRVATLLRAGVAVVCGATGWSVDDAELRKAARGARAGAVIAPNFSVGVSLFAAVVRAAAMSFGRIPGFDPYVLEWHHRAKRDAPSGTAKRLASLFDGPVPISSVRAGHEPGRHVVGFDGPDDVVTLEHRARGREAFAAGAVIAGEWILGRRGIHDFDEVCRDLVRGGRR